MGWDGFLAFVVVALILALCLYLFLVLIPVSARTDAVCLEHGYPHSDVTFMLKRYCIREIDETEYVVPLYEVASE